MPGIVPKRPTSVSYRQIWELAWPAIITNILFSSVGLAYVKIVSDDGAASIAAVTSGHRIFVLVQALLLGISVATTALVARSWGRSGPMQAARWTWQSLYLGVAISLVTLLLGVVFARPIASLFGLEGEAADSLTLFLWVMLAFNPIYAVVVLLSSAFRATGDARTPMRFSVISCVLNIVLSLVLARGLFGFPAWGVVGVALGGGIAPLLAFSLFGMRWWRNRYRFISGPRPTPSLRQGRHLLQIAIPATLEQVIIHGSMIVFLAYVAHYGTEAFAAFGLAISLLAVIFVVGFGFSLAGSSIAGQCLGTGRPDLVRTVAWRSVVLSVAALALLGLPAGIFASSLSAMMVDDPVVAAYATPFVQILAALLPLIAVESSISGVLRGMGDTRFPLISTLAGIGLRLALGAGVVALDWHVNYLFATMVADYLLKVSLLSLRLLRYHAKAVPL
ncbi:MATE family efflux transporter [Litorivivens sp.]|uniref:MATE family efflux transporter n=1 Tax=Litorivivens sp. TaxID=2020868 RepID=UPI003561A3BD